MRRTIFGAPWFARVWVLQGLVLLQDPWVQCGLDRMKWADFCGVLGREHVAEAMRLKLSGSASGPEASWSLFVRMSDRMGGKLTALLYSILQARRGAGTTNPQDLVFANLGIASDRKVFEKYIKLGYQVGWKCL